jgi:hypothetical protein
MLMGNLSEKFNKEKLEKLFLENKIPPKSRAEDIKLEDWKKISLSL